MAIHKPLIITIYVGHDVRVCIHYAKQVAGNIAIQVMGKHQIPVRIMHARAVGRDHVGFNAEVIANLPHINMMTASRKHEVNAASGQ